VPTLSSSRAARALKLALVTIALTALIGFVLAEDTSVGATSTTGTTGHVATPATSASDPLRGVLSYLHTRKGIAQVALFDKVTGQTYLVSNGTAPQYTASIVKVDVLGLWLWLYQSVPGTIPSNIPYSIRYLMRNMITMSDNSAATSLFYFGGGCSALTLFDILIPTHDTKIGCQTPTYYGWGNTSTSAADQVAVVKTLAYDNPVLTTNTRDFGLKLMESVVPAQRWGVTCGPWGNTCTGPDYAKPVPGVTVAVKNGWKYVPSCTKADDSCRWQVNSIGWVQGKSRNYVLAVLTTDDPAGKDSYGFDYGISTIQDVSKRIWENLAPSSAH
jgi:beta-lactamase class A